MKAIIRLGRTDYAARTGRWLARLRSWLWLPLLLTGVTASFVANAQQKPQSATTVVARDDRSPVRVRYPEPDRLRALQNDRDYQYGRDAPPPDNPVARFFAWLYYKLMRFLASEAYQNIWQYVFLAAIAGLVVYLLLKAEVLGFLFTKKAESNPLDYENLAENIHEINFDGAIEDAVGRRDFRLAVRLLYLRTLKRLTDANRIDYKPDKTNRQYVNELANSPLQAEFEDLTRAFEFVWYGDFPVDETRFGLLRSRFNQFMPTERISY